ncbi:MAG: DUF1566 domain-containing protein [Candidatus Auribacterota bacterium]|nr:DUF1566 domain-containing protein [Candidatus Auribacterota bacterium]
MKKLILFCLVMVMGLALTVNARGGDLDPSWGPQSGSGMYTLSEVYYYLTEGTEGSIADSFQEPTAGPGSTAMDTKVIYDDIEAVFTACTATPDSVLAGVPFFSTQTSSGWGFQTGTASAGGGGSGLPKTGQLTSYTNGDDAYYADPAGDDIGNPRGLGSWSNYTADGGRFTLQSEEGETVVVDNATGLMWEQKTVSAGPHNKDVKFDWEGAIDWVTQSCNGASFAGYTDWRLPNYHELPSIIDCSKSFPAIDTNFFPNTKTGYYWSSTTYAGYADFAWLVHFDSGRGVYDVLKTNGYYVRAVRGPE